MYVSNLEEMKLGSCIILKTHCQSDRIALTLYIVIHAIQNLYVLLHEQGSNLDMAPAQTVWDLFSSIPDSIPELAGYTSMGEMSRMYPGPSYACEAKAHLVSGQKSPSSKVQFPPSRYQSWKFALWTKPCTSTILLIGINYNLWIYTLVFLASQQFLQICQMAALLIFKLSVFA